MARKNVQQTVMSTLNSILGNLVESYGNAKQNLDEIKKTCDSLNKELKQVMSDNDITEYNAGGYKIKYIVSEKETMNEDRLLEVLSTQYKELADSLGIIKMRPYIDFDVIEKEVYNGNISKELLLDIGKCKEVKEVVTLRLSKEGNK